MNALLLFLIALAAMIYIIARATKFGQQTCKLCKSDHTFLITTDMGHFSVVTFHCCACGNKSTQTVYR